MKKVLLNTNFGKIELELDEEKAPLSVKNFVEYVKSGHYNETIFHRVINDFMIQGGGFNSKMEQKPTQSPIKNEANNGLKNDKYTIAMARTFEPHSATAQFFINVKDNSFLNFRSEDANGWGYTVFGKVVTGTEIVDKIKQVKTGHKLGHDDVPLDNVIIESAVVVE
jgi:peptidyl-prolyl cis-trans isomerase B (cyclophilin B)